MAVDKRLDRLVELTRKRDVIAEEIKAELDHLFLGRRVRVNHWRGTFFGRVERCRALGLNVYVRNFQTGKLSPRCVVAMTGELPEVELMGDGDHE